MKNFFLAATVILTTAMSFNSCTTTADDPLPNVQSGTLPKKVVRTYSQYPNTISEVIYTYDGNKLKEINISPQYDVSKAKFTYTGDNITKIETFEGTNFSTYGTYAFEYTNDKLTKLTTTNSSGNSSVTNYAHNSDGTITESYPITGSGTKKYTVVSGNITKIESFNNTGAVQYTENFTFDAKNNLHKNITGLSKILNLEGMVWDLIQVNANNKMSHQQTNTTKNYTYEYNGDNYPIKMVETQGNNTTTRVITY